MHVKPAPRVRLTGVMPLILLAACSDKPAPTHPTAAAATLTAPALEAPGADEQLDTLRPALSVRNATADRPGTRTYEFQIADNSGFAASAGAVAGFLSSITQTGVPEGADGRTGWRPAGDLQPTTIFYWRARATQDGTSGPWSATGTFRTKLVGFNRPGELYDPLIHGETVGEIVGPATFVPGRGLRLESGASHVRYLLPQTIGTGEFSMDVEGLRPNGPGDKAKVFGMQEGQTDFITNDYRIDIQYRGAQGFPPNAIQWRVIYGDADDLNVRYEPDTARRMASVFLLNPSTTYHWKFTWGPEIRLVVREGGTGGSSLYDYGMSAPRGRYHPNPHYAYLGAPVGRSGGESASIPGALYRNVWISNRPRPASLGSALRGLR